MGSLLLSLSISDCIIFHPVQPNVLGETVSENKQPLCIKMNLPSQLLKKKEKKKPTRDVSQDNHSVSMLPYKSLGKT